VTPPSLISSHRPNSVAGKAGSVPTCRQVWYRPVSTMTAKHGSANERTAAARLPSRAPGRSHHAATVMGPPSHNDTASRCTLPTGTASQACTPTCEWSNSVQVRGSASRQAAPTAR